jgi:hypothetical protein
MPQKTEENINIYIYVMCIYIDICICIKLSCKSQHISMGIRVGRQKPLNAYMGY